VEIQEVLGYLLNTGARLIKRQMDVSLEKYGITTSQWAVIKLLDSKTELSQAQISDELLGDRATLGSVILRLSEKKYIVKALDKEDRRSYRISLTPKASEMVKDIETMAHEVVDKSLLGLNENEIEILYKALSQIICNLSKGEKL